MERCFGGRVIPPSAHKDVDLRQGRDLVGSWHDSAIAKPQRFEGCLEP
jgi:hypothetical protein